MAGWGNEVEEAKKGGVRLPGRRRRNKIKKRRRHV